MLEQITFDNGLRLLLIPMPAVHSVTMAVFVGMGSRYESDPEAGAAHFIEHMLFKGSRQRPSAQIIAETIEGIGGVHNAGTDSEATTYWAKVAAVHAETAIDTLLDMVRFPLFNPDEIEKERRVIGEEISMYYDIPDEWLLILLQQTLWPNHPLGRDVMGSRESVGGLSREVLLHTFERGYHPGNVVIALAGALDETASERAIRSRLADWPQLPRPTFLAAPQNGPEVRSRVEQRPVEQGHLCLGLPGLDRHHPDRFVLSALNTILGDGMSSRLFLEIRERRGLAYAVSSSLGFLQDTGSWIVYAGVDPTQAGPALKAILEELDKLAQAPVPLAELAKAREYMKGRLVLGLEDSASQAAWYGRQTLVKSEVLTPEQVLAAIDEVTVEDVRRVAQSLLQPERFVLAAVGPFGDGEALARLVA
jgi:predicted Zn-dependent peptidase